ncbi:MAG: TetR family transcriptional regulator [Pseudomonadota bacterium]
MVRRTKEDALATREGILDAAEGLFVEQGVSRTTLQHIASAAGLTRGAIYWHFDDKAALFNAMMERAKMPIDSAIELLDPAHADDPAAKLREIMLCVFRLTQHDPKARRVFEIALLKLEYVDEMSAVRERRAEGQARWLAMARACIEAGVRAGHFKTRVAPQVLALGTWAILDGLVRAWLIEPAAFDLVEAGGQVVDSYLDSMR